MTRDDLNMLASLDALLTWRSVTGAAAQLGISQPSLSASLARLRAHFGDDLLVRRGGRYELTPLAREVAPRVARAVKESQRILAVRSDFDPLVSERDFRIRISDYAIAVIGARLLSLFERRAPLASLHFELLRLSDPEVLAAVDGAVLPLGALSGFPHVGLFADRWVCVMNRELGSSVGEITADFLRNSRMIGVFDRPDQPTSVLRRLAVLGVEVRSYFSVDSYLAVPFLLEDSEAIVLMPEKVAARFADSFSISIHPFSLLGEGFTEAFWWDQADEADPAHRFLRGLLVEASADPGPGK